MPTLQNTKFGWIIAGPVPQQAIEGRTINRQYLTNHTCLSTHLSSVETLKRFRELEEYTENTKLSGEEESCEKHFVNTVNQDASGQFIVRLPFRENKAQLGRSREIAIKRLNYLERKFLKNSSLREQYTRFMQEYIDLGHMSKITESVGVLNPVYLPHHSVIRESSTTTRLRVVFDASAKTASGVSLNDMLMVGRILQDNIIDIILRFRLPVIAITADLQKMYRQVLVHPDDRDFQKIVWRFFPSDSIGEHRLNMLTCEQASAPFLAIRCVRQLASDRAAQFGLASQVLLNDLYVDDIITGVDSESDAIELISQLNLVLCRGGFESHKWLSGRREVLRGLPAVDRVDGASVLTIDASSVKTLGLNWCPATDMFQFSVDSLTTSVRTKRGVLSTISRIFDLIGLIGPILTRAKLIMQETWASGLGWDDTLTDSLGRAWDAYVDDVRGVGSIRIPRRVVQCSGAVRFNLHAFCDASLKAYGACIYLQSIDGDNKINSSLLCSKSRVAPIKSKTATLPKLELCGAVVLVRLLQSVRKALRVSIGEVHAWSDSMIALAWIAGDPSRQKVFVSNRTSEIQSILPANHWHHVDGVENPADLISRGTTLKNLRESEIWWVGPTWLSRFTDYKQLMGRQSFLTEEDESIVRSEQTIGARVFASVDGSNDTVESLLNSYSSLSRIERVIAWMIRFRISAGSGRDKRNFEHLSVSEIRNAHKILILAVQRIHFEDIIKNVLINRLVRTSSLASLSPFIDGEEFLRMGGRMQNSPLTFERKHPIILPSDSNFTKLLFEAEHRRLLHVGPQALLYSIRENYWLLKGKNIARRVTHNCVNCFRNKPKPMSQIMGQLPTDQVTPARPFFVVGVDFAGPITTLIRRGRGGGTNKSYILLFICFATRAIHLEAVSDLSSASFVAALRRFTGRRGCPQRIYCDNAANFVGAKNELRELYELLRDEKQKLMDEFCVPNQIEWKFLPPSAPHMGGCGKPE